jgi:hypothetical protein
MRPKLLFIAFATFSLFGCKKNGGTNSPGTLLKKVTYQDSQGYTDTTIYSYDGNNRLIRLDTKSNGPSGYYSSYDTYARNSDGLLTSRTSGAVTIPIYHDPVTLHYTYSSLAGVDSTTFIYTGNVITRIERYIWNTTGPWQMENSIDLNYDGLGNISALVETYSIAGYYVTQTFSYDDKTSPIHMTNESFVLGLNNFYADYYSLNNVTYQTYATNGGTASVTTYTYTYNANNMPSTRSFTGNNAGVVTTGSSTYNY